ncbi:hypothetical protein SAMN06298215_0310 [Bacteroidales bacterium WCE2008]|nr:hypothetical protein SAMN06298215_0310 [Bacteroidales bacterium WCE2008]
MADLIGHPDTYKPTPPGPAFFCPPSPRILVVSALFRRGQLTGRLRQRQVSSWSRLCSADCVGSIPPNVYFVLLRRTRIHRAPPSNVAEGGHARRDQRTPAVFSPLLPSSIYRRYQPSDFLRRLRYLSACLFSAVLLSPLRPAAGPPPSGSEKLLSRCRRLNG